MTNGKESETDLQPSLFHAGTKITIEEAQPKRWPWVNVYRDKFDKICISLITYPSKEIAKQDLRPLVGGDTYLHTIQL